MDSNRIDVKAKIDTDFCKAGETISMKKGVFEAYHKENFEIVGETKKVKEKKEKIPTKKNKMVETSKNK